MSRVLGVTGGIASGKSTVVSVFAEAGFPVVDGDVIARQVVEPQSVGLQALVEHFGKEILLPDGNLNRKKLGRIIFSDPQQRGKLDKILDPYIRKEIGRQIEEAKKTAPLVIADIPLLYERDYVDQVDQVAVVYVSKELQKERLQLRDQLSEAEAKNRIASQLSLEEKKKKADIVFDNQGSIAQTKAAVKDWLQKEGYPH